MIKLKCPRCDSDKIEYSRHTEEGELFECEECSEEFYKKDADWEHG